ncbi:hypothetical protein HY469_06170, partial [Candidatus Roizmanbacteria bacterium]|nr:hypothetical protein [Candidatus Roizmanbacteria bacterium]
IVVVWWLKLQQGSFSEIEPYIFNWFYGLIALVAAIKGIRVATRKWGGWNSVIGRGLILLSVGLISQWFGLQIWTYYNLIAQVEVPYPSLADVGYFGLVPAYTYAAFLFAKASGAQFSLKTTLGRLLAIVIPLVTLLISYVVFLKDVGVDLSYPIRTFFDIAYPLGEILPVSIALFTLTLSRNLLGGKMRTKILYLVGAFFFQFITEYMFLYAVGTEVYVNGGINDLMYATSYTVMAFGLIAFNAYE